MGAQEAKQGNLYWIRVKGSLERNLTVLYGDMVASPRENNETILEVFLVDQSALRGLLDYLWDRNIAVISVERRDEHSI